MKSEPVRFTGALGHELAGLLDLPARKEPAHFALFAHCFTCGKSMGSMANISRVLTAHNIAVLRFDFTGVGESQGDFSETNFTSNYQEVVLAGEFLAQAFGPAELLIGHSFGGLAAIEAAKGLDSIEAVAVIGCPAKPSRVLRHFPGLRETLQRKESESIVVGDATYTVSRHFVEDVESYACPAETLSKPLLVMQSPEDDIVPYSSGYELFESAAGPKSFICLDGVDHLMVRLKHARYIGELIVAWAKRYFS